MAFWFQPQGQGRTHTTCACAHNDSLALQTTVSPHTKLPRQRQSNRAGQSRMRLALQGIREPVSNHTTWNVHGLARPFYRRIIWDEWTSTLMLYICAVSQSRIIHVCWKFRGDEICPTYTSKQSCCTWIFFVFFANGYILLGNTKIETCLFYPPKHPTQQKDNLTEFFLQMSVPVWWTPILHNWK